MPAFSQIVVASRVSSGSWEFNISHHFDPIQLVPNSKTDKSDGDSLAMHSGGSYGMMSASWDPDKEGSALGAEEPR